MRNIFERFSGGNEPKTQTETENEDFLPSTEERTPPPERNRSFPMTPQEKLLESREITESKPLGGVNKAMFVKFKDDGAGVFKAKENEEAGLREHIEAGTYYKRERAAYLVDRAFGFGLVPPTVIREVDGKIGTVQEYIEDSIPGTRYVYEAFDKNDKFWQERMKLWVFDHIIYNSDRHYGNFRIKEEKIYAIDNGLSFGVAYLSADRELYDAPVPKKITKALRRFVAAPDKQEILRGVLGELLTQEEVESCFARIKRITEILKEHKSIPWQFEKELTARNPT